MRAAAVAALVLAASLPALGPAHGQSPLAAPGEVVVAVVDTGLDAAHPEFAPGQLVAWWDFAASLPAPGQRWDHAHSPSDPAGHGTATASLAVGQSLGRCPQAKLAVAKVANAHGVITGDVAAAVAWAAKEVRADVISISLGSKVPLPARLDAIDERIAEARAAGALVVVSAGNGLANAGLRVPSTLGTPNGSPHALVVGATGANASTWGLLLGGYYSNLDPHVVAWGTEVPAAKPGGGTQAMTGTSFSTPQVAGWAACLRAAAVAHGRDAGPARLEALLKGTARDHPLVPYAVEGHGTVDEATHQVALAHAAAGTSPPPAGDLNRQGEGFAHTARWAWTDAAEPPAPLLARQGSAAPGTIGASLDGTVTEVEVLRLALAAGEAATLRLVHGQTRGWPVPVDDLDLLLMVEGADADGLLSANEVLAASTRAASWEGEEAIAFRAGHAGTYTVLVVGYLAAADLPYAIAAEVDGQPRPLAFGGERWLLGSF